MAAYQSVSINVATNQIIHYRAMLWAAPSGGGGGGGSQIGGQSGAGSPQHSACRVWSAWNVEAGAWDTEATAKTPAANKRVVNSCFIVFSPAGKSRIQMD
jgi:hypothetical protein